MAAHGWMVFASSFGFFQIISAAAPGCFGQADAAAKNKAAPSAWHWGGF
jgi:hypothetical protein